MDKFSGRWIRKGLVENGSVVDNPPTTIWMQSASSLFVDLRSSSKKSFAGYSSLDPSTSRFTWNRKVDLRGTQPLDVGRVTFETENILIEDSVLPGDDFTETWCRDPEDAVVETDLSLALDVLPTGSFSFSAELCLNVNDSKTWGCVVCEGSHFAIALGREPRDDDDEIAAFFSSSSGSGAKSISIERVNEYVCVMGRLSAIKDDDSSSSTTAPQLMPRSSISYEVPRIDPPARWTVTDSSHEELIGKELHKALPQLKSWRIDKIKSGLIPTSFALLFATPLLIDPSTTSLLPLVQTPTSPLTNTTHLFIVRHGETSWNVHQILQGQLDVPLNECGHNQALAAGKLIAEMVNDLATPKNIPFGIISSDLRRPYATAVAISSALHLNRPPFPETRLRETHLGSWQGRSWDDVEHTKGDSEDAHKWRLNPDHPAGDGEGESVRMRFHRVVSALYDAALVFAGGVVVVVAHGGVIDDIGRLCKGTPFGQSIGLRKHNCSVCHLTFTTNVQLEGERGMKEAEKVRKQCGRVLEKDTIEPEESSKALGKWVIEEWGVVKHLEKHTGREDPLADSSKWAK